VGNGDREEETETRAAGREDTMLSTAALSGFLRASEGKIWGHIF
jgi:hypothetical protein